MRGGALGKEACGQNAMHRKEGWFKYWSWKAGTERSFTWVFVSDKQDKSD